MSREFRMTLLRWTGAIAISLICFIMIQTSGVKEMSLLFGPAVVFGFRYAPGYAFSCTTGAYQLALSLLIWIPTDFLGRIFQILLAGVFALWVGIVVLAVCGILSIVQGVFEVINNTTGSDLDIFKSKAFSILDKLSDKIPQAKTKRSRRSQSSEKSKTTSEVSSAMHEIPQTQSENLVPMRRRRALSAHYDTEHGTICVDDGRIFTVDTYSETIFDENDEPVEYDPETNVITTKAREKIRLYLPS